MEGHGGGFRARVVNDGGEGDVGCHRGDGDHGAVVGGDHGGEEGAHEAEVGEDVDGEEAREGVVGGGEDGGGVADAGVVD